MLNVLRGKCVFPLEQNNPKKEKDNDIYSYSFDFFYLNPAGNRILITQLQIMGGHFPKICIDPWYAPIINNALKVEFIY